MEKILVDVNGCVCPDRKPYSDNKDMRKATRKGPGHPVIFPRKKKDNPAVAKADGTNGK